MTEQEIEYLAKAGWYENSSKEPSFEFLHGFDKGYKAALQNKVSDISEDGETEFELLLKIKNELLEADKLPFAKRVEANKDILNFVSIKRKQKVEPIPTVDEDELWMRIAEIIVGYNIGKKNTTTKHALNNRIDILKQQFSITRK